MTASDVLRFARPATLAAPVAGVIGGAVAARGGWPPDPLVVLLAVASALFLTGASNGMNQIADVATDRINRPERPLPSGRMSMREAWVLTATMLALAVALAVPCGAGYLACVLLTVPVTAAYSFPPLRTKRLPFAANATIATPRGVLLVLAGWAVGGGLGRAEAWILAGIAGAYVFGAATTKDFADADGDRATGCVTLPILWGPRRAAMFVVPFLVAPFLALPALAGLGALPGGAGAWARVGLPLAGLGGAAGALLVRSPAAPESGRPHPAWGLMYLQYTAFHAGTAALFAAIG